MSIYGEGAYQQTDGTPAIPMPRTRERMAAGDWNVYDAQGNRLQPIPTPETSVIDTTSVYALGKYDAERLCLILGNAYQIPTTALRFFNTYGPRQALSNPYTGLLAIAATCFLSGNAPRIYEDGQQTRDFVSVHDIARACRLAAESPAAAGEVLNIGSGRAASVNEVVRKMAEALHCTHFQPVITQQFRVGDIRHCLADIRRARALIGYEPQVTLEQGMVEIVEWLRGQTVVDRTQQAQQELASRGLLSTN